MSDEIMYIPENDPNFKAKRGEEGKVKVQMAIMSVEDDVPIKTAFEKYLQLDTLEGTHEFFAEVIQRYCEAGISERNLRALCYALNNYQSYWKLRKDLELEERLEKIEERLDDQKKN